MAIARASGNTFYIAGTILVFVALLFQLGMATFIGGTVGEDAATVLFYASLSMLILLLPYLLGVLRFDLFSPYTLMIGALLMGTGWRIPFIIYYEDEWDRIQKLMYEVSFDLIADDAKWFAVGILFLVLGYLSTSLRIPFERSRFWMSFTFDSRKLMMASLIFGVLGAVFGIIFLGAGGVNLGAGIAAARKIHVGTLENVGLIAGTSRFFASWASYPFLVLAGLVAVRIVPLTGLVAIMLALMAIPVFGVPFMASSRSAIVLTMMSVVIVMYYYGRIDPAKFLIFGTLLLMLIAFMGDLRAQNRSGSGPVDRTGAIAGILASGNGVDMMRTLGIFHNVPERTGYLYGSSYLTFVTFPVPRAIWKEKPEVGLGPFVKSEILGGRIVDKNGWPSSIIGEAWLNFGKFGLVFVMFLYGAFQRIFYNSFKPFLGKSFILTLVYGMLVWKFAFSMTVLNFSHGLVGLFQLVIPMMLFLAICRKYVRASW